jgi:acetyl-CoA carboxylase biotin carboxyl carrier protein
MSDAARANPDKDPSAKDVGGLVDLIDRLEKLLNESELSELEVEAGQTALVLRKAGSVPAPAVEAVPQSVAVGAAGLSEAQGAPTEPEAPQYRGHIVAAPLTGLFYTSPSPGAEPYVREGGQVSVGQVIGLIEAMKLFNEIKSDVSGKVLRIHAETGSLVKTKQPLIEVES